MKILFTPLTLLCALTLCGCAGRLGRNVSKYDKVETTQVQQLVGNNLTQTPFDQKIVYLNARCDTQKNGQKQYFLFTEVIAPADFTLQPGESLILNVDGEVFSFAPTNAPSFNGRKRYTTTFYPVSAEVMTKLSNAQEAFARIKGTTILIDKKLSQRNIRRFDEFASRMEMKL